MTASEYSSRHSRAPASIITPIVYVVDDDVSLRESLELLIRSAGWRPNISASAEEFLEKPRVSTPSCLLLDVNLPDINGLDLQELLADRSESPIIFLTGHGDIPMAVQAMKAGAVEFLTKPVVGDVLLRAVRRALTRSHSTLRHEARLSLVRDRYRSLSRREREVMLLAVSGRLNKQIAAELVLSEITVKVHRGKMMRKMGAGSLAELVTMATRLRIMPESDRPITPELHLATVRRSSAFHFDCTYPALVDGIPP
jgi:FixJ family two-component response regulator